MLAGSVYTFQTIALTRRREHQKEATVICMLFLVADFKVGCRGAVRKIAAVTLNKRKHTLL